MKFNLTTIDRGISTFMSRWGVVAVRVSLGIIFVWFGALKPFGLSPAEPLVKATVRWLPIFSPDSWVVIIGWWEVAIGVLFLLPGTIRVAIALGTSRDNVARRPVEPGL